MSIYRKSYKDRAGVSRSTSVYYCEFRDHLGRTQIVSGFRHRSATQELERKLLKVVSARASDETPDDSTRRWIEGLAPRLRNRLAKIGVITSRQVAGLRPLEEMVEAWAEHLRAKGTTGAQVKLVTTRARRVLAGTGAAFWTRLDPSRVEQFLRQAREQAGGMSSRTSNFHLQALRQFCRWAVRTGLALEDPLRVLEPLNAETDRRRTRRALTSEELAHLIATTAEGPAVLGVCGTERAVIYRVATETGLRRNELATLTVAGLDLQDLTRASVRISAGHAKNRHEARLPLREATAQALAALVRHRLPTARVFSVPKDWRAAEMLRTDLAIAEIPDVDGAGRVVDFHSLRVTFGTNLARAGVSLQVAQKLMRHSTPTLTANVYTVLGRDDERRAVQSLPEATREPAAQRATGTDGAVSARSDLQADLQGSWSGEPGSVETSRDSAGADPVDADDGGATAKTQEDQGPEGDERLVSAASSTRGSSWVPGGPPGLQNR